MDTKLRDWREECYWGRQMFSFAPGAPVTYSVGVTRPRHLDHIFVDDPIDLGLEEQAATTSDERTRAALHDLILHFQKSGLWDYARHAPRSNTLITPITQE